jgi:hypothetical protein
MTTTWCADCDRRPATVFLPEGRYLCSPCWEQLRELRQHVVHETALRTQRRAQHRKGTNR